MTPFHGAIQLTYSFTNPNASVSPTIRKFMDDVEQAPAIKVLEFGFLLNPLPVTNGTKSLGLPPNTTDMVLALIGAGYENPDDIDAAQAAIKGIYDQHVQILQDSGNFLNYTQINYAGEYQDLIGSYGDLETLQAVSKKYDPEGLFQIALPEAYKLF